MDTNIKMQEMIQAVQELTIKLGRVPQRTEFETMVRGGNWHVKTKFGNYAALLHAAGLEAPSRIKLNNDIFKRDLVETLQEYQPREIVKPPAYSKTLVIGDTHFPFINQRCLDEIYKFAEVHKPQRVIQVGDLYDMYSHSKFPRSHNIYTPDQEEDLGVKGAKEMWSAIRKIVPKAECIQLKGNHDIRPIKRTLEVQPAAERAMSYYLNKLMTFEGVTLIEDSRQEYIVEGIEFIHGYRSKLGDHRDYAHMNTVCGHIHRGGVVYKRIRGQTLWELNAGFVGDAESKALSYTGQKIYDSTVGFGYIDEYGPRFIAL